MAKQPARVYSAKEKAELLLSNLEKLKAEVSVIQSRYDMRPEYTEMCDDAILRIRAMKTELEKDLARLKITAIKTNAEEDLETEITEPEAYRSDMGNVEAKFKLGLVPVEEYLRHKALLNQHATVAPGPFQSIIDKAADCIEFALDKIGDGIIFPAEKLIDVSNAISRAASQKGSKRHNT